MDNLTQIHPFEIRKIATASGMVTILTAKVEVATKNSITFENNTLAANYIYNATSYQVVYTIIDAAGELLNSFAENAGILPTLFTSPHNENYVSIVPYHPDKELEISIPLFNRDHIEMPKGNRPFTGNFIGTCNNSSIFYDVDTWSNTKPDKLLAIEFKGTLLKQKNNVKIPLPQNNKIYISNNEIHLLVQENDKWLHRQIDEQGNEVKRRIIEAGQEFFNEILNLSFEATSYVLLEEDGKISIVTINADGTCSSNMIAEIEDEFYNTWSPVKISSDTSVIQFNTEFGNGWLTIKEGKIMELFYSKEEKAYKNLQTNEMINMPNSNLIISSVNKTKDNAYAMVFYPKTAGAKKCKEIIILNRAINGSLAIGL